jgi:hypothetical protein
MRIYSYNQLTGTGCCLSCVLYSHPPTTLALVLYGDLLRRVRCVEGNGYSSVLLREQPPPAIALKL